nr:MAG TPA: DNA-directed RNA polymerase II [Caudoviricetes sp.]
MEKGIRIFGTSKEDTEYVKAVVGAKRARQRRYFLFIQ